MKGFLNVDVDVRSTADLSSLVRALGQRVVVMHSGRVGRRYWVRFVLGRQPRSPAEAIRAVVRLLDGLSPLHQRQWRQAAHREFDVGWEAPAEGHPHEWTVDAETLAAVARVGASLRITTYRGH